MDSLQRVAVVFAVVAAAAWTMAAYSVAETLKAPPEVQAPAETLAPPTVPDSVEPGISGSSTEPLSNRLDRSRGVLRPPGGIDPGLMQSPPSSGPNSTPEIAPPGTPGGKRDVNPK